MPSAATQPDLNGLWSTEPNCAGLQITYGPGNRWRYSDGREGTYSFSGETYTTVETGGPTTVMRVVRRENNAFETVDPRDGFRATRYRCTSGANTGSTSASPTSGGIDEAWLSGRWCTDVDSITFRPEQRSFYMNNQQHGSYALSGNQLTMTAPGGASNTVTITRLSPDALTMSSPGQGSETARRC